MISHAAFDQETTATEAADAFGDNIRNRTLVIVGVSPKSLGESFAHAVARHSPHLLILASRSADRLEQVANAILEKAPKVKIELVVINLADQQSIRRAAEEVLLKTDSIDLLINNAAINPREHEFTRDGIEMQFGTNHVGHFLFTNLVLSRLKQAAKGSPIGITRIINVTSQGHRLSPIRFHDYNFEGKEIPTDERPPDGLPTSFFVHGSAYSPFVSYGQSKTANILFSQYLSAHLKRRGILSIAVHPGCKHLPLLIKEAL
jgi:NAD(P)-dependent dehydrogenase (short-subunit alcohol dehydrogenase family)